MLRGAPSTGRAALNKHRAAPGTFHRDQMYMGGMRRLFIVLGAAGLALVVAASVQAAAPRYILVDGPRLERPILLADWEENHALILAVSRAPRAKVATSRGLARRPRYRVALFWGWPETPRPTRPSQANQRGWFYPARRSRVALIELPIQGGARIVRLAPARVLRIFARHGVPTRM